MIQFAVMFVAALLVVCELTNYLTRDVKQNAKNKSIVYLEKPYEEFSIGWYFLDEASQLNGPFESEKEAEKQLNLYCLMLG